MQKNNNCKLADHKHIFNFKCENCPKRIKPSLELQRKGLTCAYQKNLLTGVIHKPIDPYRVPGAILTRNGTIIKYFGGARHYWNKRRERWELSKYQEADRNVKRNFF